MQFMNCSRDKLVKNLSDKDFKYLVKECSTENLKILKQKGAYHYGYMNGFKRFVLENIFIVQQKIKKIVKMV